MSRLDHLHAIKREVDAYRFRLFWPHRARRRLAAMVEEAVDVELGMYDDDPYIQALRRSGAGAMVLSAAKAASDKRLARDRDPYASKPVEP